MTEITYIILQIFRPHSLRNLKESFTCTAECYCESIYVPGDESNFARQLELVRSPVENVADGPSGRLIQCFFSLRIKRSINVVDLDNEKML